jgi:DNA-binding XRE family transcriptional regulator
VATHKPVLEDLLRVRLAAELAQLRAVVEANGLDSVGLLQAMKEAPVAPPRWDRLPLDPTAADIRDEYELAGCGPIVGVALALDDLESGTAEEAERNPWPIPVGLLHRLKPPADGALLAQYRRDEPHTWVRMGRLSNEVLEMPLRAVLDMLDSAAAELVAATAAEVREMMEAAKEGKAWERKPWEAALARAVVADRWPWTSEGTAGRTLLVCQARWATGEGARNWRQTWPKEAAPEPVWKWLIDVLKRAKELRSITLVEAMVDRDGLDGGVAILFRGRFVAASLWARLWAARFAVETDRKRPAMAVDTGVFHKALLDGWQALPKDGQKLERAVVDGRIELLIPGSEGVQLTLGTEYGLTEAMVDAVRDWQGWDGLYDWAALQAQLSAQGRTGAMLWNLDTHLEARGYSKRSRRDPVVRARVGRRVELLTRMELAVYEKDGRLRERRPVFHVERYLDEGTEGGGFALRTVELRINPALYSGVRNQETKKLGTNFYPTTPALAKMDRGRNPTPWATLIGLKLAFRFKLTWKKEGLAYVDALGSTALRMGGIKHTKANPGRAWDQLERSLDALAKVGGLGRWEWRRNARELDGLVRIHADPAWVDRTIHGVRAIEAHPAPATGAELKAGRKRRGQSQADLAAELGISKRSIERAEAKPSELLARKLRAAVELKRTGG